MKKICFLVIMTIMALNANAQANPQAAPKAPQLEFALQLRVTLDQAYSVGETPKGRRTVIPITGGTFEGPKLKGTIISGGADYQMANGNRTEIEAIYSIKTDDGVYIHVRNCGLICPGTSADGRPSFYFRCAPKFEAPADSKYAWMNNALFLCAPDFGGQQGGITLNGWEVKKSAATTFFTRAQSSVVSKPVNGL